MARLLVRLPATMGIDGADESSRPTFGRHVELYLGGVELEPAAWSRVPIRSSQPQSGAVRGVAQTGSACRQDMSADERVSTRACLHESVSVSKIYRSTRERALAPTL